MKALSLWQPWASLIALGVKTIETRGWATKYRGPLAIHAAQRLPRDFDNVGAFRVTEYPDMEGPRPTRFELMGEGPDGWVREHAMPFGAIAAVCTLVDCLPILEEDVDEMTGPCVLMNDKPLSWDDIEVWEPCSIQPADIVDGEVRPNGSLLDGFHRTETKYGERPYGEYASGRFAWMLADVVRLDKPIRCGGRQGLWNYDGDQLVVTG
jgi:hypothetical protein